ncbi:AI-2E family transporter [Oenococcus alcoholitolerans]|uniref:AI-2E family transporter n=1 Tax=Oenococcus alcoholitolerans TaxID=931074 RepID=UPI003F715B36
MKINEKITPNFRKTLALLLIIAVLIFMEKLFPLIIFTCIISYLLLRFTNFLREKVIFNRGVSLLVIYAVVLTALALTLMSVYNIVTIQFHNIMPMIQKEIANREFLRSYGFFKIDRYINNHSALTFGLRKIQRLGFGIYSFVLANVLSFIFVLTHKQVFSWIDECRKNNRIPFFADLYRICVRFVHILGSLFTVQITISLINTTLMTIGLYFLNFPYLITLFFMILILGMIPILGVVISLIPLSIIAYSINGWTTVIILIILTIFIHLLETYFLHPRLMSNVTRLPVFVILLILIFMEHLLGIWGMIVGLPIVTFLLDFLGIYPFGSGKESNNTTKSKQKTQQ